MPEREPYIPVTVLTIKSQRDFGKISTIINGTYEAVNDNEQTRAYKKELAHMQENYHEHLKKLKSNPFGVYGAGSHKRHNSHTNHDQFEVPFKRLTETKPLLE